MSLYLHLLKRVLTGMIYESPPMDVPWMEPGRPYSEQMRIDGSDWPSAGHTMIGLRRLAHLEQCVVSVVTEDIPGDLIECGAWRGGACILMRAVLEEWNVLDRMVWVADSFQGLPRESDGNDKLMISQAQVAANFRAYGLLDEQVGFIPGWFHESLPGPVRKLALLRLDGDQYESQLPALERLYPLLSKGGFVIIDDYPGISETVRAVYEYRQRMEISTPIQQAGAAGWWRKE